MVIALAAAAATVFAPAAQAQGLSLYTSGLATNSTVFGPELKLGATVSDFAPARVDFYVDDTLAASDSSAPYEVTVTWLSEGPHRLQAKAMSGNVPVGSEVWVMEVINPGPTKLLMTNFTRVDSAWAYADDVFRGTAQPAYAREKVFGIIELGGIDEAGNNGMSGGYVTTITLAAATQVQVRFGFEFSARRGIEQSDAAEVLVSVDGQLRGLNGNDYVVRTAGPDLRRMRVMVPLGRLGAGSHRIVIGAHADQKTDSLELTTLDLAWGVVETLPAANVRPTVAITSPAEGAMYPSGSYPLQLEVAASDSDGKIVRVELYPSDLIRFPTAILTSPPYRFTLYASDGVNRQMVVAYDNRGAMSQDTVTFQVGNRVNGRPRASYLTPFPGQEVKLGGHVLVNARAWDDDGTITKLDVYIDEVLRGTDTTAPYGVNASVAGLTEGAYGVRLVPWDNEGGADGAAETYIVVTPNFSPTVAFSSLVEEQVLPKGSTVDVHLAAADPDGSVSRVELWVDGATTPRTDTTAPFAFALAGLAPGLHTFQANAVDNRGRSSVEPTVVTVSLGATVYADRGTVTPSDGPMTQYNPGDIVTVAAGPAPAGMVFDQWLGVDRGLLGNPWAPSTTLKVPTTRPDLQVSAAYKPAPNPTLVKLVLINADTNRPIAGYDPLYNGAVLTLSQLPSRNLNVRAVTLPEPAGSVLFVRNAGLSGGVVTVENQAPYAMRGDLAGNYLGWTPVVGNYTLTAWVFTGPNKAGVRSHPLTINFKVAP